MSDYKIKYIKYKLKYLNLLGGMGKKFGVIKNNGSNGTREYSNQCMWLSILDYLNGVLGNNFSLDEIRAIGSRNNTEINGKTQEFDTLKHYQSLLNVIETFDLQIHLYVMFRDENENQFISDKPNLIVGALSSSNVVSIVSYGSHFELITLIGNKQLYAGKINISDIFVPNRTLALGHKFNEKNNLKNKIDLKKIDELLEISINYKRIILDLEQELELNQSRLTDEERSFVSNDKNLSSIDEEMQIALITSFQEIQIIYEKKIKESKNLLEDIKELLNKCEKELAILIS